MDAIITVGLGYGDEGKGSIVDYLVRKYNSELVIRYSGGHQCGHNVVLPDGRKHTFSQFGAGTLAGAHTWVDRDVLIEPFALMREAVHLHELGIYDPYQMISMHPSCLVTTPYHKAANRAKEQDLKHGSCGVGIGETRRLWREYGAGLMLKDIGKPKGTDMIFRIRDICQDIVDEQLPNPYEYVLSLANAATRIKQEPTPKTQEVIIFEGAQGMLLDEHYGIPPHTTWSTVTPRNAVEHCDAYGWDYEIIGIARSYMTRHGAGPFTEDLKFKDENNPENEWQGRIRSGKWDHDVLQQTALDANCNYLAINHLDEHPLDLGLPDRVVEEKVSIPVTIKGYGPTHKDKRWILP